MDYKDFYFQVEELCEGCNTDSQLNLTREEMIKLIDLRVEAEKIFIKGLS